MGLSVYSEEELKINDASGESIHVIYFAKLNIYTEISVEFTINNACSISIRNGVNTRKIIPSDILIKIQNTLIKKYKEEIDSMPIFQCISFCNELLDDEQLDLVKELDQINIIKYKDKDQEE